MKIDRPAAVLSAALAVLVIGLVVPPPKPTLAQIADKNPLAGRWTLTKLAGNTLSTPAGDITFDTADSAINGATACNFFRGRYEAEDGALTLTVAMMTRRGCSGVAADHERGFLEAMAATRATAIDSDRLTLTDAHGHQLAELIRTPDAALEGPRHKIVSYLKDGGLYSVAPDHVATIAFNSGHIEGDTGCRPFTAHFTRNGDALTVTDVQPAQTLAPCGEAIRDQDDAILQALPRATTFDTSRNLVRLLENPDGAALLWITPQDAH